MYDNEPKISLGSINFTNCLPLNCAFSREPHARLLLTFGYPALLNTLISEKQLHISPVSSIEYIRNKDKYSLIETLSISSKNDVGSVILFSKYKFENLEGKKIGVPFNSATSAELLKILLVGEGLDINSVNFKEHKYQSPLKEALNNDFDAILYIGDAALVENFKNDNEFFKYDMGELWNNLTGKPMVFAVWAVLKEWQESNYDDFDDIEAYLKVSLDKGLGIYFEEIVSIAKENLNIDEEYLRDYFLNKLNYDFDFEHRESLDLFENLYNEINAAYLLI
jgi:chorismate dehydratase